MQILLTRRFAVVLLLAMGLVMSSAVVAQATPSLGTCPTMAVGSRGDCVKSLQQSFAALGVGLSIDGDFGAQTEKAVRAFQSSQNLKADGVVGPATRDRLNKVANSPAALGPQGQDELRVSPDGHIASGGVYHCGNAFGTCSFYFSRPMTKELARAFNNHEIESGLAQIAMCHRLTGSAVPGIACDVFMLLASDVIKKTSKAAADGNGCLRIRWTQDPMVPVGAYNDGGRNCIG